VPVEGEVADFIDDQDGAAQVAAELAAEVAGGVGSPQLADHVVQGGEVDRFAGRAGGDGQGAGQVRLAGAGRAQQRDVGGLGDEAEGGEVLDLADVEVGLEGEVEVVEGLVVGQAGDVQGAGEAAV